MYHVQCTFVTIPGEHVLPINIILAYISRIFKNSLERIQVCIYLRRHMNSKQNRQETDFSSEAVIHLYINVESQVQNTKSNKPCVKHFFSYTLLF